VNFRRSRWPAKSSGIQFFMTRLLSLRGSPPVTRVFVSLLAVILMFLIRKVLDPVLGANVPYLVMFPAIVFSAWFCGIGPSILAATLAFLGEQYWFIPPVHTLMLRGIAEWAGAIIYFAVSAVIIVLAENSQRAHAVVRKSHAELEDRVEERTRDLHKKNQELIQQAEVVRELSALLLRTQDEERRRIARDLHDSLGQLVVALNMNLSRIQSALPVLAQNEVSLLNDSISLVGELLRQIRTISHLLHPPLLDEVGLASAIRWYAEEFSKRSKIQLTIDLPAALDRLPADVEISVFRVIQECLTNVHRHSNSAEAGIRLICDESELRAEVWDRGRGMSSEKLENLSSAARGGVGIRGMRERLRQFGGTLEVRSDAWGTRVVAKMPAQRQMSRTVQSR
jgi:signal transduction histidine kinase